MSGDAQLHTFGSSPEFRAWLRMNYRTATELLVRCFRVDFKHKGLTYREALDEALCFGWIDGVRRKVDEESFSIRFTPRRAGSYWSTININRARELEAEGRMHRAGSEAFAARGDEAARRYSFESTPRKLPTGYEKLFRANSGAWSFFRAQAPWYQRTSIFWVTEAKREETRLRRLQELIDRSALGQPIKPLAGKPLRPSAG